MRTFLRVQNEAKRLGFRLITGRVKASKIYLVCNQYRSSKCTCSFTLRQEAGGAWSIISKKTEHNHQPLTQPQYSLTYREVPEELKARAVYLAMLGVDFKSISKIVREEFKNSNCLSKDIRNAIQKRMLAIRAVPQVHELLEEVEKARGDDKGFYFSYSLAGPVFQCAIWASSLMQQNLQKYGKVVLFDPTCLTNSLRLPFAFFLAIDGNGRTVVISACILANETISSFDWVMSEFRDICGTHVPDVFYTDRCPAIHCSLRNNFASSHHLICRWHLAKNIVKNLAGKLRSSLPAFVSDFYRLAESREPAGTFEQRWSTTL